jgi:hypothetical protein
LRRSEGTSRTSTARSTSGSHESDTAPTPAIRMDRAAIVQRTGATQPSSGRGCGGVALGPESCRRKRHDLGECRATPCREGATKVEAAPRRRRIRWKCFVRSRCACISRMRSCGTARTARQWSSTRSCSPSSRWSRSPSLRPSVVASRTSSATSTRSSPRRIDALGGCVPEGPHA